MATSLLTGELSLPLGEALLLHGVQVGQVVVFVFQGLLFQAERSQTSGRISACKHSVRPLCNTVKTHGEVDATASCLLTIHTQKDRERVVRHQEDN